MAMTLESIHQHLTPGPILEHENLAVQALLGSNGRAPDYLTLDEALKEGLARVTEVSEAGRVPELLFENRADRRVLLVDGEELEGAKQNRVLNLSIMVPARTTLRIPVSCVEAGRWRRLSGHFSSSERMQYARGRARKLAQVSASLERHRRPLSDQGAVWQDIDAKMESMRVSSPTRAMSDIYKNYRLRLEEYVKVLKALPDQCGAVFFINGRPVGLELFDAAQTYGKYLAKIIRGYALDALDAPGPEGAGKPLEPTLASRLLQALRRAEVQRFPATGEGQDIRFTTRSLQGAALEVDGHLVHLLAFCRN